MRHLTLALLLAATVASPLCAGERQSAEPFPTFLSRFASNQGFRETRIKYPLHAILGNPTDPRIREKWSRAQLKDKFTPPVASNRLELEGLEQKISFPSETEVEVTQSQPQSDSYILIYRFKLKDSQWFLVNFENSSY